MNDTFKILDKEIIKLIETKMAKPDKTIMQHTEDLFKELNILLKLGYIKEDRIYDLVSKAIVYHDIGKVNDEFQKRVMSKSLKFDKEKEVVHNILSLYFINKDNFECEEDYIKVAHSVMNHHYYCNNFEEMSKKEELINEFLSEFNIVKIKRKVKSKIARIVEDNEAIKIKGYLHKCDYSASSNTIVEYQNDFLTENLERMLKEWKNYNKEASWNELQNFCKENESESIIAVAQTGMGKTEAGLLWIGDNKGFFVLPIRTAINAIYDRVSQEILKNKDIEVRTAILHSSALEYYIRNTKSESEESNILKYYKTGKSLAIPLNIATMDSIFDFVYKYPGYELKLTTLSYSKIVIDEIQAYGSDLLAYLICGLEKVNEAGGKIAVLTATLPPFIKNLLKKNINFKESDKSFVNNMKRHNIKVLNKKICYEDIKDKFVENKKLGKNNKILVVCNTIKEAQNIYESLHKYIDSSKDNLINEDEIHILHSRFIRKDRSQKEKDIIDFGRTYDKDNKINRQNGIWVSTSIVEASLDIDFDYLFTELQELNSLFQRFGRCNRKGVKDACDYNCYVYTIIDETLLIDGDKGFIDKTLFDLSKKALTLCDGLLSEEDKIKLIDNYLTSENLENSDYMRKYNDVYNYIKNIPPYKFDINDVKLRHILSEDVIPGPVYEKYLEEIKGIESRLLNKGLDKFEKVKLRDELMQYTVSVYPSDVNNYERAVRKGMAVQYNSVFGGGYKRDFIKVIECEYGESGYKRSDYKKLTSGYEIL